MEVDSELSPVDRARLFWSTQDLDSVFCEIHNQLNHLQTRLQTPTPSDTDLEQSLKVLEAFDWPFVTTPPVVQVVIGLEPAILDAEPCTAPPALASGTAPECKEPQAPAAPEVLEQQQHFCSKFCVPTLSRLSQSRLWALNPLNVPLVYGFQRLNPEVDQSEQSVVYTAPCGLRLCNHDDVMDFLLMSESFHLLQSELFSFSSCVSVDPCPGSNPGLDLSRGLEMTPVELCLSVGVRPPVFKYRRDRWPHGCFLSNTPDLYRSFCDCQGRCGAEGACPCISMTTGHGYKHGRLQEPNKSGIVECGPWCGCDPGLCQNRVVQRGLRVRLQVYKTKTSPDPSPVPSTDHSPDHCPDPIQDPCPDRGPDPSPESCPNPCPTPCPEQSPDPSPDPSLDQRPDRGWGVRCKDDLEQGTFICVYAGVVLLRGEGQSEAPPPKRRRTELAADDEIQLVTEWLPKPAPNTDPSHVPVIQRGSDLIDQAAVNGTKQSVDHNESRTLGSDLYLIDARKEGNASRFFNHSCDPTLFVQKVFTDSHDQRFPLIAFFTNRALKAGTELTWDYNSTPSREVNGPEQEVAEGIQEVNGAKQEVEEGIQEVPCLCRSVTCRQHFNITELRKSLS